MPAAFILAIVVGSAEPSIAAQRVDLIDLVSDACVETRMRRADFERLAQTRRWRPLRSTSNASLQGRWNLIYRAGDAVIMLDQRAEFQGGDPTVGSVCTVAFEGANEATEEAATKLAASLGLEDEAPVTDLPSGYVPMRIWSQFNDRTLTYAAAPDGRATISLSRQFVTSETAPVSPTGN